jgi:hypothetical protein
MDTHRTFAQYGVVVRSAECTVMRMFALLTQSKYDPKYKILGIFPQLGNKNPEYLYSCTFESTFRYFITVDNTSGMRRGQWAWWCSHYGPPALFDDIRENYKRCHRCPISTRTTLRSCFDWQWLSGRGARDRPW